MSALSAWQLQRPEQRQLEQPQEAEVFGRVIFMV
jgi:hypothetical protein